MNGAAVEAFEKRLVVRQHNRFLLGGLASLLAAALLFGFTRPGPFPAITLILSMFVPLVLRWAARRNFLPVRVERHVTASVESLRIGSRVFGRAKIEDARVVPLPGTVPFTLVRISAARSLPIELEVVGAEGGRELLRALGFDVSQTVSAFAGVALPQASARFQVVSALVVLVAFVLTASAPGATLLLVLLCLSYVAVVSIPSRIQV
ncbi:MAG TPA: hypothetical protein VGI39_02735, partial [Polyangiaceae bacterium]